MFFKNKKGFTLIEILIAMTIVAILAALAIVFLSSQLGKGRDARRKGDLDRIKIAVEEYQNDHNCYPLTPILVCDPGTGLNPYLNKIPCDPITGATYYYEYDDNVCPRWFRIYAKLDNTNDPGAMAWCGGPGNNNFNYYVSSPNAPSCVVGSTPAPGGGQSGTPVPPPVVTGKYFGCKGGACVPIAWDYARPGPECDPNFQDKFCYTQCGPAGNECKAWR